MTVATDARILLLKVLRHLQTQVDYLVMVFSSFN